MYSGQWKDECRHGIGTMYWRDRGEQYTGQWVDGIQVTIETVPCDFIF